MVGVVLENDLNISFGRGIAGLGIILTLWAVYFLTKHIPQFGSPSWAITMLGVFSATMAISWHSHYYMAMVLIPFLIYGSIHQLLPQITIFLWVTLTPIALLGGIIFGLFDHFITRIGVIEYLFMFIAFSGFIMNLILIYSSLKFRKDNVQNS